MNRVGVLLIIVWAGFLTAAAAANGALPLDIPAEAASNTMDAKVPTLREVITTATRSKRKTSQVPASVSVITREEIAAAPANNVDDLLRGLAGIDIKRITGLASGLPSRLSIRGVPGYNPTLLLMDDIPLNAVGTGFVSTNEVPLNAVERVEMARGPFSSLYGSNAFGGVVNVLTSDPSKKASGSVSGELGNDRYRESSVSFSDTLEPVGLFLQADTRATDNYYSRDHLISRRWNDSSQSFQTTDKPAVHYGYHEDRAFGKVVLNPTPSTRVTLHGQFFRDILGVGQTIFLAAPQDVSLENHAGMGAVQLDSKVSEGLEVIAGGYGRRRSERIFNERPWWGPGYDPADYDFTFSDTVYWDWQGGLRAVYRPHPDHVLTLGADTLLNEGRFDPAHSTADGSARASAVTTRSNLHDTGIFLQEEWTLGKLVVVPSGRLDHNTATDWTSSPKVGVILDATETLRLRSSAGLAFRAPTLSELYAPDVPEYGISLRSNPRLRPEYLDAYDFGIEKDLCGRLTLGVDAFTNYMRDLINLSSGYPVRTYVNINRAASRGFDTTVAWKPSPDWKLSLNHTYQWVFDRETKIQLDYTPQNKGNVTAVYSHFFGKWRLEGNLQEFFSGTRFYTDDETARRVLLRGYADTSLGVKVSWFENAYVETKITNLFNASYEETGNYLTPGRMIQVGSGIRF